MRFTSILIVCLFCSLAHAQETSAAPKPSPESQAAELRDLRRRLEELAKENLELKSQIAAMTAQITSNGLDVVPTALSAAHPAEPAKTAVPFTWANLFAKMPPADRPNPREGWDVFTKTRATKWVEENILGLDIEATMIIDEVRINGEDAADGNWRIGVQPKEDSFNFGGFVNYGMFGSVHFAGDEAMAKRFKAMKSGARLRVRATIQSITIEKIAARPGPGGSKDFIREQQLRSSKLQHGLITIYLRDCQLLGN